MQEGQVICIMNFRVISGCSLPFKRTSVTNNCNDCNEEMTRGLVWVALTLLDQKNMLP